MSIIYKLLLSSILIIVGFSSLAKFDSLRIEKINGQKFIVHRVDPKETLYSISKRYNSSIDEIYEYNESIQDGLKMYDELIIPYYKKKKNKPKVETNNSSNNNSTYHIVAQGETLYSISRQHQISVDSIRAINDLTSGVISIGDTLFIETVENKKAEIIEANPQVEDKVYHTVAASETLFAISRQYDVSVEQLTEWNNLESYNLEIGQELIVGIQSSPQKQTTEIEGVSVVKKDSIISKPTIDTTYVRTDNSVFKKKTEEVDGKKEVTEEGFAMRIEDTDFTTKLLALHKTAPMGSLVKVKNEMTDIEIEVRVVGALPDSGLNRNVLLRLSGAAYDKLGALDLKIPVTSTYVED